MSSIIKLPFGLNEYNRLVHINDVENGKKCNCFCAGCHSPLIAVKGNIKQHHFRHDVDQECAGGLESAIHLAAKQKIRETKQITLPVYAVNVSDKDSKGKNHYQSKTVVADETKIFFDTVEEEVLLREMKADILAIAGKAPLVIEIFYRHKVDEQKTAKIRQANISAIEIDLSDLTREDVKDWEAFESYINDPKRIKWLHNARKESYELKLRDQVAEQINRQEEEYKKEAIAKEKKKNKEKAKLVSALGEVEALCSEQYIAHLKEDAKNHPLWKTYSEFLNLKGDKLPCYLDVDVPNGDWIFGCDRRVWQTAIYAYFIQSKYSKLYFSMKLVEDWLSRASCRISQSARVVSTYGKIYPELLPQHMLNHLPSSWKTLGAYFKHLCRLDILMYSPSYSELLYGFSSKKPGGAWYMVMNKAPRLDSKS